ncbi:MAG: efflux RND transporter permease subunit, partial [Leptonema sp. (in: Bacteria)]|nr:efflux RND transporter permease subunit [Leptonema sp. (in: bacteria)]
MGKIVAFFLNRPMLVNLSLIALLILGVYSTVSSRKEGFPEISLNRVMIQTIYPGASASDVETEVTNRIEEELQEVDGIKDILSYSEESVSRIEVRGKEELTAAQFKRLYSDIDDAINRIDDLPSGLRGRPALHEIKTSDIPVIEIAYTGEYKTLKPYLDDLKFRLRRIQGVAGTDVVGLPDEEVKVLVNASEAKKRFVDLRMIAQALSLRNSNGSGGVLYTDNEERKITVSGGFENFKDILNTNVMANSEGYGVKLKEFATIEVGPEDLKLIVRNNGYRGATLTVRKSGSADLIDTVNRINDFLSQETLPEQVEAKILIDQSKLTKDRIS